MQSIGLAPSGGGGRSSRITTHSVRLRIVRLEDSLPQFGNSRVVNVGQDLLKTENNGSGALSDLLVQVGVRRVDRLVDRFKALASVHG